MWQIYERKEYALTRGGLTSETAATTNSEKSEEVIVLVKKLGRTELQEV